MNEGLFDKYKKVVQQKKSEKDTIIEILFSVTGVVLESSEVTINNRKVSLTVSSVKKMILQQKKAGEALKEKGYYLSL